MSEQGLTVLVIVYVFVGLITNACFFWCFGIPNPRTKKEKTKANLIQTGLIVFWPLFFMWLIFIVYLPLVIKSWWCK